MPPGSLVGGRRSTTWRVRPRAKIAGQCLVDEPDEFFIALGARLNRMLQQSLEEFSIVRREIRRGAMICHSPTFLRSLGQLSREWRRKCIDCPGCLVIWPQDEAADPHGIRFLHQPIVEEIDLIG